MVRGTLVDMLHTIPFFKHLLKAELHNGAEPSFAHVLIFGAITVHDNGPLGCIASNKKLGEDVGLSTIRAAHIVSDLAQSEWIKIITNEKGERMSILPTLEIVKACQTGQAPMSEMTTPFVKRDNIDNIINNIKENTSLAKAKRGSKKKVSSFVPIHDSKDINALILYFYSKIIPAVSPVFSETNRKAFDNILGLSTGVQEVRDTIDKAEKILLEPYNNNLKVSSIVAFAQKFKLIQSHVFTTKKSQTQTTTKF